MLKQQHIRIIIRITTTNLLSTNVPNPSDVFYYQRVHQLLFVTLFLLALLKVLVNIFDFFFAKIQDGI